MRLIPNDRARRRIAWTGNVDSSSGAGLNWRLIVAPPRPKGGRASREMDGGRTGPTGLRDIFGGESGGDDFGIGLNSVCRSHVLP